MNLSANSANMKRALKAYTYVWPTGDMVLANHGKFSNDSRRVKALNLHIDDPKFTPGTAHAPPGNDPLFTKPDIVLSPKTQN